VRSQAMLVRNPSKHKERELHQERYHQELEVVEQGEARQGVQWGLPRRREEVKYSVDEDSVQECEVGIPCFQDEG